MITPSDFLFKENFPTLTTSQIQVACDVVETQWAGVAQMWTLQNEEVRLKKIALCQNFLVGWYLACQYPVDTVGIPSNGGVPVQSKSVGGVSGVSVTFRGFGEQDALIPLSSNGFGVQAIQMITSCTDRFKVYG